MGNAYIGATVSILQAYTSIYMPDLAISTALRVHPYFSRARSRDLRKIKGSTYPLWEGI